MPVQPHVPRLLVLADANSIHTERWVRGLAGTGHIELRLVTMNPAGVRPGLRDLPAVRRIDELYAGPVKTGGNNWRYLFNLPKVIRLVRRMEPDAIVAIYLSSYGLMGAIAKGDAALVQVVIGSDAMITPGRSWLYGLLARRALARSDLLVSASQAMTSRLSSVAEVPREAILTQQYGVEDWIIGHPRLPRMYDFVSNRAWVANSRIPMVLRLFSRLQGPVSMALVGGGTPADPEILGIASRDARVIPLGVLPHRQNVQVVAQSGFYLSMTESDGASLSLMEAMAVGAIPVVSDIEPNREWVKNGVNGVLVPLDDEAVAISGLEGLLACSDTELEVMRQRNREIIRERGSIARNMARFRDRLDAVLTQRKGVRP